MVRPDDKRITIMFLISSLRMGGAETELVNIAPLFDREKFRVIVVCLQPGPLIAKLESTHVEVRCISFRMRSVLLGIWRLYKILKREHVDVLHTHMWSSGFYGRIAGILAHVPVMVTTDHDKGYTKRARHRAWERFAVRFTSRRIAVTQEIAAVMSARENVPPEKLLVIPNGVDVASFNVDASLRESVRKEWRLNEKALVVGSVSRLVKEKSLHVLIEAFATASRLHSNVRLVIVGRGPLREPLERRAADFGVSKKVFFAGVRNDIPQVLAAMDVYALSSSFEGLPLSILEAMAAGKPIVSTKVGGIPDVITDGEEGLLVEANNSKSLAAALDRMLTDLNAANLMGAKARKKAVANYSAEAIVKRLEEVYTTLLGEGASQ